MSDERRDRDQFGRGSRGDGQEKQEKHGDGASLSEQCCSSLRRGQTSRDLSWSQIETESSSRETEGSGERQRDRQPSHASNEVTLDGSLGLGSDSSLPVSLVKEDGSAEDQTQLS